MPTSMQNKKVPFCTHRGTYQRSVALNTTHFDRIDDGVVGMGREVDNCFPLLIA